MAKEKKEVKNAVVELVEAPKTTEAVQPKKSEAAPQAAPSEQSKSLSDLSDYLFKSFRKSTNALERASIQKWRELIGKINK